MSDHIVHIEPGTPEEVRDLTIAKAISEKLARVYPNHYWLVSFTGGALIVRHVLIASLVAVKTGKEGFGSLLPRAKIGTVHDAVRVAVKHAGALLEAFKLPRGAWDGTHEPQMPEDLERELLRGRKLQGWR